VDLATLRSSPTGIAAKFKMKNFTNLKKGADDDNKTKPFLEL
jgi:hypothetical protein